MNKASLFFGKMRKTPEMNLNCFILCTFISLFYFISC